MLAATATETGADGVKKDGVKAEDARASEAAEGCGAADREAGVEPGRAHATAKAAADTPRAVHPQAGRLSPLKNRSAAPRDATVRVQEEVAL